MAVSIQIGGQQKLVADVISTGTIVKIVNVVTLPNEYFIYTGAIWLPCDGSAVSRTTYEDLFAAVSTTFGSGDGVSTFNVPTKAQARVSPPGSISATTGNTDDGISHTHDFLDNSVTIAKITNAAVTEAKLASASVSQAKLKTSYGEVSITTPSMANLSLPGGEYGFYPQVKKAGDVSNVIYIGVNITTTYTTNIYVSYSSGSGTTYARQRYVTSSGEVFWIFLLRDSNTKEIIASYYAPDHPCFGNGGDPDSLSHPFPDFDPAKHEIIVLNPDEEQVFAMKKQAKADKSAALHEAFFKLFDIGNKNADWPKTPVTIGLPDEWDEAWHRNEPVKTNKVVIPHKNILQCKAIVTRK